MPTPATRFMSEPPLVEKRETASLQKKYRPGRKKQNWMLA
jgi:hypothetical protein